MQTNLLDCHVVDGYGEHKTYQKIMAVYLDRGILTLLTLNPDGHLVKRDAENCCIKENVN